MKQLLIDNKDLYLKIEKIENKLAANDEDIQKIFSSLKELLESPAPVKRKVIGFPYPNKK